MTPDGDLLVDIHAISNTYRGRTERGKPLEDRWYLWYWLIKESGERVEHCQMIYWEKQALFETWGIDWPYDKRVELEQPIGVIFSKERELVQVSKPS